MEQICLDKGLSDFNCSLISGGLYLAYVIFFIALIAVIILPLFKSLQSPKDLIRSGAGLLGLVVIFLIAYSVSGDEVSLSAASLGITPAKSKLIGAGLITLYTISLVAVAGLIFSSINRAIK